MARHKKRTPLKQDIESRITGLVYSEYTTAKSNQDASVAEYESIVDLLECKRNEKSYSWLSDVFIPEFPSIVLTDAGGWANTYFQSRDFVEVRLEADDPDGVAKCRAAKNTINKTLNIRGIYHYPKYIRGRLINSLSGNVYAVEWWDRETTKEQTGVAESYVPTEDGTTFSKVETPVFKDKVVRDHYNYEIIDPANIYTDNSYVYSIQDKPWITIRSEKSLDGLKRNQYKNNYINLDKIEEALKADSETETSRETYNKEDGDQRPKDTPIKQFDYLERYGLYPVIVTERAEDGFPIKAEIGYDEDGSLKKDYEEIEMVIGVALVGGNKILCRFQPQYNRDPNGKAYRPILRGTCYIHPRKDSGLSDGKYLKEPQVALNDAYNMSADRTTLATLPTFKGRRNAIVDNDTVYMEPEHIIELEDPKTDLEELKISDNIDSALNLFSMLTSKMQQVSSVYPTTMGDLPAKSGTTATAVAGAESRTNLRANYKSLTYEYTFLIDQYAHILWMTYQYATEETAKKMMGEDIYSFDANADYSYTPVTSQIESEHGKQRKLQLYEQLLGRLVALQHPDLGKLVSYIVARMLELLGDEFSAFKHILPRESIPMMPSGASPEDTGGMNALSSNNQNGMSMGEQEQSARESFKGMR